MQLESSPDVYWVIFAESKRFLDGFKLKEMTKGIFIVHWEPQSPEQIGRTLASYMFDEEEPQAVHCQYMFMDNRLKGVASWVKILSQLFHLNIRILDLNIQLDNLNINDLLQLLRLNVPMDQFSIKGDNQDYLIRKVLDNQKATQKVSIRVKPSPLFQYDTGVFSLSSTFECSHSHWITFDQMCYMKSGDDLQLDEIVNEEHVQLERYHPDEPLDKNHPVKFYKFHFFNVNQQFAMAFEANGYHIIRDDGRIATFYISSKNNALFHVHPENCKKLKLAFHVGLLED